MNRRPFFINAVVAVALVVFAVPESARAQYFGANKVQYQSLRFHLLTTDHFDVYFHQDDRGPVVIAGRLAERWWTRLSNFFGREPFGRQPLVLYSSHIAFEQTLVVPDLIDAGTGGLTEPWRRRIVMPLAGPLAQTDRVLGHELVHAFQFDLLATERDVRGGSRMQALPLWVVEGLAEYLALGPVDTHTAMWLRDAVLHDDLPSIQTLQRSRYFPYRWGHAFWAYVGGRWGDHVAAHLFLVAALDGVPAAIDRVLGVSEDQFIAEWHSAIRTAYPPRPDGGAPSRRVLVASRAFGGSTNIGPALSPDGRWVAFLSERSFFTIDLFIADTRTGDLAGRLTDTAVDPHFSNLQFVDSAGAWDRDSRRLAVGVVTSGRAAIAIFGWPGGAREREVIVSDVDEIYNPTWSPDGRSIAFSAIVGGVIDLFVYDLDGAGLRRLTHDSFAELHPAWEPDGRRIAFVTDRFTTDLDALAFGAYRLALVDVDSAEIRPVPAFPTGKHIGPQWSLDGRSLYFISDSDGTPNLYRVELAGGALDRLTSVSTGMSGLTALSPAFSVAPRADAAVAAIYERGRFAIYTVPLDDGEPVEASAEPAVLRLPPIDAPLRGGAAAAQSESPLDDSHQDWPVLQYLPRLSLEGVSQTSLGVGVDRFGATVGTSLSVQFSDILNTHWLTMAVQMNQGLENGLSARDTGMFGGYLNQMHRWNWGVIGSQLPSYAGVRAVAADSMPDALFTPIELIRQTERTGTLLTSYALNRARRVELQGGVSRLSFDRVTVTFEGDIDSTSAAAPLTLANASAALVHDTTNRGALSVVRGERYRLEAAPAFGTIRYVNVLADYRRYVMPVPFYTIAARALHFARYGSGADDPRVPPLYLGYPSLVRGYDLNSRISNQCVVPLSAGCQEIDHMLGSRIAVGNLELRFPVLRPLGISPEMYGPVPVEVALFVDGGLVWRRQPVAQGGSTGSAWSTGVTLRANVLGLGVSQFDIARPFRTVDRGWVFQINLVPSL